MMAVSVGRRPVDFAISANKRLPDEMQRSFSDARVYWEAFNRRLERSRESRTTLTREMWATELFELLGFSPPQYQRAAVEVGGATFPISHRTHEGENATPVHIVAVDQGLEERSTANRRTPHALVQEFLNRSEALWGVVTNGEKLRLLRDSARLSKPTYLEFDLRAMIEGNAYSEFVVFYRLLHYTRFPHEGSEPHECLLENYYNQGIEKGGRVREKLRDGVKSALETLGTALVGHPRNDALRGAIREGQLDETGYYRQLLNFVYRVLFLMVTEERKLLFTESGTQRQAIYERYYSVTSLRDRAERLFTGDAHGDLWDGLAQTFRLFREEEAARRLGISPLNGELFRQSASGDIEAAFCPNESFLAAMRHLSTFDDSGIRRRVNYAHLDVEEFGSVYESLLDYRPVVHLGDASGALSCIELAAGTERKQTGSYYTPPELVRELVESALVPVMEERLAGAGTPTEKEKALLALRVCDPASGSGHFLLAAARRIARELATVRTGDEAPVPTAYRAAIRDVVRSCIYAVDKNPLAVDLCKVALWIESHATGLPLGFLDHHVKCGDSLVGVKDLSSLTDGIPNVAYKPVTGDDKKTAGMYLRRNRQERGDRQRGQQRIRLEDSEVPTTAIAEDFAVFATLEEQTPNEVLAKEELYGQLRESGTTWWRIKTACDLWTRGFFAPLQVRSEHGLDPVPTTRNVHDALNGRGIDQWLRGQANAVSQLHPFFHWPLEFPDVFEQGGFDVVLGNPPWERIKLQEKEFFGTRDHDIANASNKAARNGLIRRLPEHNPALAEEFAQAIHGSESTSRFVRGSDRFPLTGRGDVNTYSIFAETARSICRSTGRVGMIVPSGVATDDTTKVFFADLVDRRSLVSLYDFENREKVFPGIDSRIKFCLLTLTGADRQSQEAEFAFFLYRAEQLQDPVRRFVLASEDFALFNPNTRTCPVFRTRRDMEIARKMYERAGVFVHDADEGGGNQSLGRSVSVDVPHVQRLAPVQDQGAVGGGGLGYGRKRPRTRNPWGVTFQRMFDMSNDSNLFRTKEQLEADGWAMDGNVHRKNQERYLPLYEAKLFHQYDHRFATFEGVDEKALRGGNAREMTPEEKADPEAVIIPRYWVPEGEVDKRLDKRHEAGSIFIAEPSRAEPSRAEPSRTEPSADSGSRSGALDEPRTREQWSQSSNLAAEAAARHQRYTSRLDTRVEVNNQRNESKDDTHLDYTVDWFGSQSSSDSDQSWQTPIRKTTNATNERTSVISCVPRAGMSDRAPLLHLPQAKAAALLLANMNSIVLDFAARTAVGGTDLSFFIIKQLPVLPPETYLEDAPQGLKWVEMVIPRVLELTYTAHDLEPFAHDLGYDGPPFPWDEERRHLLRCELDAIYAHMYKLERTDLEWVLDAQEPSQSFPGLKRAELRQYGEYRTQRYALQAYDQLARGELPDLAAESLPAGEQDGS